MPKKGSGKGKAAATTAAVPIEVTKYIEGLAKDQQPTVTAILGTIRDNIDSKVRHTPACWLHGHRWAGIERSSVSPMRMCVRARARVEQSQSSCGARSVPSPITCSLPGVLPWWVPLHCPCYSWFTKASARSGRASEVELP